LALADQRARPLAIVIGGIGKLAVTGYALHILHHVVGLQELGYEVHYIERQNRRDECYDPETHQMVDDPTYALAWLRTVLPRFSIDERRFSFLDLRGNCHGSGWRRLEQALDRADFVLTVANPTWFDELERCPHRAYIDGDPLFTQVSMATGVGPRAEPAKHYGVLFSYGTRIGQPDCAIPLADRYWLPARPVVATSIWQAVSCPSAAPITALLHWSSGSDVAYNGRLFGYKDREFPKFADLPRRVPAKRFRLAAGGGDVPSGELREAGWELASPLAASLTIEDYMRFVSGSLADFGVAKHAYVASRSGWFSDRSTCFLAAGRPVLHQDTGFTEWLPTGAGVLAFSTPDEAVTALEQLDRDYKRHSVAARAVAEEHFEARRVLAGMLDAGGLR
jgi:hypothetical protein